MKKLSMVLVVVALILAVVAPASAQGKLALNIGANVMIPMGTFGDVQKVGIGGTVQGEYAFMPQLLGTAKLGYISWGGKEFSQGGVSVTGGAYKGVPFLVGGKYFFMPPARGAVQFYGQAEIGLFFGSVSTPEVAGVHIPGVGTFGGSSAGSVSSTDFVFSPSVGLEYPMGNGALDASLNYFLIAASGSAGNLGLRVGYKFAL
jgi:hypothetical protein